MAMKREERILLVATIRKHREQMAPHQKERLTAKCLSQAADCIEQLENELDAIHENFLNESE